MKENTQSYSVNSQALLNLGCTDAQLRALLIKTPGGRA